MVWLGFALLSMAEKRLTIGSNLKPSLPLFRISLYQHFMGKTCSINVVGSPILFNREKTLATCVVVYTFYT